MEGSGVVRSSNVKGFGSEISSGQRVALGRLGLTDVPGWTLGVVDFSRKVLDSLDTWHHPDADQILTTT